MPRADIPWWPKFIPGRTYGRLGRDTASSPFPVATWVPSSSAKTQTSKMSQGTSILLIQKGPTDTSRVPSGVCSCTVPAGIGTMSSPTVVPGISWV